MSTLNQAFIKVYQQQRVNAPHVRFPARPSDPAEAAEFAVKPMQTNTPDAPQPPRVADERGAAPTPQSTLASAAEKTDVEQRARLNPEIILAAASPQESIDTDAAVDPEPSATPATLVRRFHWPALVESLHEAAAIELRRLTAVGRPRTIATSSCQRGDGGTTMTLLIARQLSSQGARVVLVDADLEEPALADRLGVAVEVDWQWAWREKLPLEEALIESLADGMALLPLQKATSADARQASPAALNHLLAELARRYDVVCIDGGPLDALDDKPMSPLGGAAIDLACVVRDARRGQTDQAERLAQRIERAGVQQSIIVDNFVRATHV